MSQCAFNSFLSSLVYHHIKLRADISQMFSVCVVWALSGNNYGDSGYKFIGTLITFLLLFIVQLAS